MPLMPQAQQFALGPFCRQIYAKFPITHFPTAGREASQPATAPAEAIRVAAEEVFYDLPIGARSMVSSALPVESP